MRDWSLITCPRCDFEQSAADECARCGVIFAKLRRAAESWRASAATAGQIYRPLPRAAVTSQEAWHEIRLFLFLTFLFSAPCYWVYFLSVINPWELPGGGALFVGLFQWTPGAAAIATRVLRGRDLRGFGWGWGKAHVYLPGAAALPFLLAPLVYIPIWAFGFGAFDHESLAAGKSWFDREGLAGSTLFLLPVLAATLGEEIGWRGLLTPHLCRVTSPAKASLLTGLVWAAWHYPIAAVQLAYSRPDIPIWYALFCFTATVVGLTFLFTWLRMRSRSLWPALFLHVSCNGAHFGLDALTHITTAVASYVVCQDGAGFAVLTWLFIAVSWRSMGASLRAGSSGRHRSPAAFYSSSPSLSES